jgi:hypothetical protein
VLTPADLRALFEPAKWRGSLPLALLLAELEVTPALFAQVCQMVMMMIMMTMIIRGDDHDDSGDKV